MEHKTRNPWPGELEFKTRMPWPDPDDAEEIFKWMHDNIGKMDVDWFYRKGSDLFPSPSPAMKNLNLSFKRDEDRIKFILKWC